MPSLVCKLRTIDNSRKFSRILLETNCQAGFCSKSNSIERRVGNNVGAVMIKHATLESGIINSCDSISSCIDLIGKVSQKGLFRRIVLLNGIISDEVMMMVSEDIT